MRGPRPLELRRNAGASGSCLTVAFRGVTKGSPSAKLRSSCDLAGFGGLALLLAVAPLSSARLLPSFDECGFDGLLLLASAPLSFAFAVAALCASSF